MHGDCLLPDTTSILSGTQQVQLPTLSGRQPSVPGCCVQARVELQALITRYCAYHGLEPAYRIQFVFDRLRLSSPGPGGVLKVPMASLVPIADDASWARFCPCDRTWWDLDLYPGMASRLGVIGVTRATVFGNFPALAPAGIQVHHGEIAVVR